LASEKDHGIRIDNKKSHEFGSAILNKQKIIRTVEAKKKLERTFSNLPAKSTRLMTAPFAISFPASFLLFWMKVMPTMVCALDDVAFMFVLATVLQKKHSC
jgi:hypothetical protein